MGLLFSLIHSSAHCRNMQVCISTKLDTITHVLPLSGPSVPTTNIKWLFFFVSQIIQIIYRCEKKMLHSTNSTFLLRLAEHHLSFLTRWGKYLSRTQVKAFETVYQLFWLNGWSSKVWQSNYLQNPIDPSPHVWICNNGKSSSKINSKKLNIET